MTMPETRTMAELEASFPEWAVGLPRINLVKARIMARVQSHTYPEETLRALLDRLNEEGDQPVYDEMVKVYEIDPLKERRVRAEKRRDRKAEVFGILYGARQNPDEVFAALRFVRMGLPS